MDLGTTLSAGTGASVTVATGATLTDDGTMTLAAGSELTLAEACCYSYGELVVAGVLDTTDATITGVSGTGVTVNSGGTIDPAGTAFNVLLTVPYADVSELAANSNVSFEQIDIETGTMASGTLALNLMGTNTTGLSYEFPGSFTVGLGATLAVGPGVPVTVATGATLTDDGMMTLAAGDTLTLAEACCYSYGEMVVAGALDTTDAIISGVSGTGVTVNSGGTVNPAGTAFNVLLTVPYADVAEMAANSNVSFEQIDIETGTMASGTLALNLMGTNTTGLSYEFPGSFTVGLGATLAVGAGVPVTVATGATLTDDGTMTLAAGSELTLAEACCYSYGELVVAGALDTTDATISGVSGTGVTVNSGGTIDPAGTAFNVLLTVPYADVAEMAANSNVSFEQIDIETGTMASGTLALNLMGTNTTGLSYEFPGSFTVGLGATLAVGAGVPVTVATGATLTDDGTMTLAAGSELTLAEACCYSYGELVVAGALDTTDATISGVSGTGVTVNSGGTIDPAGTAFNVLLTVPYADVSELAANSNVSFEQIDIETGTMASGTLALNLMGTNTTGLSYEFPGSFTVGLGATLAVGPGVPVTVATGATLTDDGTMTLAAGSELTLAEACCYSYGELVVAGALDTTDATITGVSGTGVTVNSGGTIDPVGTAFDVLLTVPYAEVATLAAGGNVSFEQVNIETGSIASGTLSLGPMGTNTSDLSYAFTGNFTIAAGATLAVGAGVPVTVATGATLTDDGTMTLAAGSALTLAEQCCYSYGQMVVAGILDGTDVTIDGTGSSGITVNNDGNLSLTDSTFSGGELTLNAGSTDTINTVVFSATLNVNSEAAISITGNNFSGVPTKGVVASGDANADINLAGNYWGSTVIATITAKIVNHATNANLPTIVYQPFVSGASGTTATPATVTFSPTSQTVNLSATVSTTAGVAINEGTETFTILNGSQVIGQTTAAGQRLERRRDRGVHAARGHAGGPVHHRGRLFRRRRQLPALRRSEPPADHQPGRDGHDHHQRLGNLQFRVEPVDQPERPGQQHDRGGQRRHRDLHNPEWGQSRRQPRLRECFGERGLRDLHADRRHVGRCLHDPGRLYRSY